MASGQWGGALQERVFRVNVRFDRQGQKCQTGFHLRDVGLNGETPEAAANAAAEWATNQFVKLLQSTDRITEIDAENLTTREGFSIAPANAVGILASTPNPSFMQCTVALKGSLRRRYGNGRMLWPVAAQLDVAGNVLAAAGITRFQTVIDDLMDRFAGSSLTTNFRLVHLHEQITEGRTPEEYIPASWYDITSARLNTTISMLRRRRQGVGS